MRHFLISFLCLGAGSALAQQASPELVAEVFAGPSMVKNVTAICFDDQGRLYATESYRWRNGIEDNRDHLYWVMDDLASQDTRDRDRLLKKWADSFTPDYFTANADRVMCLEDRNGDGRADIARVFADGFDDALDGPAIGLLAGKGGVYMTCIPHLWFLADKDNNGRSESRQSLQEGFGPRFSLSGHDLHGLVWGPDGKLYFSVGDRGYALKTREGKTLANPGAGAVFRCDPDGANMELFYYGLRNPQELAFNEFGDLFTVDNNCDQGDEARVCYLLEGGDTGWHMGHQALSTFEATIEDGGMEQAPHWLTEHLWEKQRPDQPAWILPPIDHLTNGPSGLVFHSGTGLGDSYRNHFLVCDYKGSSNQCFLYSFKVEQDGAGYKMRDAHVFHNGITAADVDLGWDGKIYLGDFGGGWVRPDRGNIITLHDPDHLSDPVVALVATLVGEGFERRTNTELIDLLTHQDIRIRSRAQWALAKRGNKVLPDLIAAVESSPNLVSRLHALWALGQLKASRAVTGFVYHGNAELRAQAARILGNLRTRNAREELAFLLRDESPRVQTFAAIALGRIGHAGSFAPLVEFARSTGEKDVWRRHAAVFGLAHVAKPSQLANLSDTQDDSLRLVSALALRRQAHPAIKSFLSDKNPLIVAEAVRAINDLPINDAMNDLADRTSETSLDSALSEPLFRRYINAAVRSGRDSDATTLIDLANNQKLPENRRHVALRALLNFASPPPIDPTLGAYRPLEKRQIDPIKAVVGEKLQNTLATSKGEMALCALQAARTLGVKVGANQLSSWVTDSAQKNPLRREALRQLAKQDLDRSRKLARKLWTDKSAEIRVIGAEGLLAGGEPEMPLLAKLRKNGSVPEMRLCYNKLGESSDEEALDLLASDLDEFDTGNVRPSLALDLFSAAEKQPKLRDRLQASVGKLEKNGKTLHHLALNGGDPERGKGIFNNQGTCLKCHRAESSHGGGNAGPRLTDIALRMAPTKILQSIVDPNAEVVRGYGIASLTLRDGTIVTGTPLGESDEYVLFKTGTTEPERIPRDKIAERTPPVSAMPPLVHVLPKEDLRDLLAYLTDLVEISKTGPEHHVVDPHNVLSVQELDTIAAAALELEKKHKIEEVLVIVAPKVIDESPIQRAERIEQILPESESRLVIVFDTQAGTPGISKVGLDGPSLNDAITAANKMWESNQSTQIEQLLKTLIAIAPR